MASRMVLLMFIFVSRIYTTRDMVSPGFEDDLQRLSGRGEFLYYVGGCSI